jgi:hypothetical protein
MNGRRDGVALILTLFALLLLAALAAGLLSASVQSLRIAESVEESFRARTAAESALRAAVAGWRGESYRDMAIGEVRDLEVASAGVDPHLAVHVEVERLASPLYLLRAQATTPRGAVARAALVIREIGPAELAARFPAALATGSPADLRDRARVEGFDASSPPPSINVTCLAPAVAMLIEAAGSPDRPAHLVVPVDSQGFAGLGPLGWSDLAAIADRTESGSLVLGPRYVDGRCDEAAAGNWGAPLEPADPCADYAPLIFAPGDLRILGGQGQGILIVAGDLRLEGDAHFAGPVLVGGRVVTGDSARITGAVAAADASGPTTLSGDAAIAFDPCAILKAFTSSPALDRAFRPGGRTWVPAF